MVYVDTVQSSNNNNTNSGGLGGQRERQKERGQEREREQSFRRRRSAASTENGESGALSSALRRSLSPTALPPLPSSISTLHFQLKFER